MDPIFFLPPLMRIMAALSFVGAVALVVKLYLETDKGWYWLCLVLSILSFAVSQWLGLLFPLGGRGFPLLPALSEGSTIVGSILLMVSFYGMYKTMHNIRKRVE